MSQPDPRALGIYLTTGELRPPQVVNAFRALDRESGAIPCVDAWTARVLVKRLGPRSPSEPRAVAELAGWAARWVDWHDSPVEALTEGGRPRTAVPRREAIDLLAVAWIERTSTAVGWLELRDTLLPDASWRTPEPGFFEHRVDEDLEKMGPIGALVASAARRFREIAVIVVGRGGTPESALTVPMRLILGLGDDPGLRVLVANGLHCDASFEAGLNAGVDAARNLVGRVRVDWSRDVRERAVRTGIEVDLTGASRLALRGLHFELTGRSASLATAIATVAALTDVRLDPDQLITGVVDATGGVAWPGGVPEATRQKVDFADRDASYLRLVLPLGSINLAPKNVAILEVGTLEAACDVLLPGWRGTRVVRGPEVAHLSQFPRRPSPTLRSTLRGNGAVRLAVARASEGVWTARMERPAADVLAELGQGAISYAYVRLPYTHELGAAFWAVVLEAMNVPTSEALAFHQARSHDDKAAVLAGWLSGACTWERRGQAGRDLLVLQFDNGQREGQAGDASAMPYDVIRILEALRARLHQGPARLVVIEPATDDRGPWAAWPTVTIPVAAPPPRAAEMIRDAGPAAELLARLALWDAPATLDLARRLCVRGPKDALLPGVHCPHDVPHLLEMLVGAELVRRSSSTALSEAHGVEWYVRPAVAGAVRQWLYAQTTFGLPSARRRHASAAPVAKVLRTCLGYTAPALAGRGRVSAGYAFSRRGSADQFGRAVAIAEEIKLNDGPATYTADLARVLAGYALDFNLRVRDDVHPAARLSALLEWSERAKWPSGEWHPIWLAKVACLEAALWRERLNQPAHRDSHRTAAVDYLRQASTRMHELTDSQRAASDSVVWASSLATWVNLTPRHPDGALEISRIMELLSSRPSRQPHTRIANGACERLLEHGHLAEALMLAGWTLELHVRDLELTALLVGIQLHVKDIVNAEVSVKRLIDALQKSARKGEIIHARSELERISTQTTTKPAEEYYQTGAAFVMARLPRAF